MMIMSCWWHDWDDVMQHHLSPYKIIWAWYDMTWWPSYEHVMAMTWSSRDHRVMVLRGIAILYWLMGESRLYLISTLHLAIHNIFFQGILQEIKLWGQVTVNSHILSRPTPIFNTPLWIFCTEIFLLTHMGGGNENIVSNDGGGGCQNIDLGFPNFSYLPKIAINYV